jgi:cation:H+ antiporter
MAYPLFLIAAGIASAVFGAKILVDGGTWLARRFRVSDLVIGLTIVAFGTSAPELVITAIASKTGKADLALGNIIGSNISNICLILALAAVVSPLKFRRSTAQAEIPLTLLAAIVAFFLSQDALIDGAPASMVSRIDGFVLLCFFAIYMAYMASIIKRKTKPLIEVTQQPEKPVWFALTMVLGGILALSLGGDWIVDGGSTLARIFGVSEAIIGLTLVSVGTSIPELATSLVAAVRHKTDIIVGNVVGSNLFNTFLVLGTGAIISPMPLGNISLIDFLLNIAVTLFLLAIAFLSTPSRISRWEGIILLSVYVVYVFYLFMR